MTEFMPAEAFPLAGGVVVGLVTARFRRRRLRLLWGIVLSVLVGLAAAHFSGELRESWAYLVFDVGQVLVAALVTSGLLQLRERRGTARVR
jgi:hypothetical protein